MKTNSISSAKLRMLIPKNSPKVPLKLNNSSYFELLNTTKKMKLLPYVGYHVEELDLLRLGYFCINQLIEVNIEA